MVTAIWKDSAVAVERSQIAFQQNVKFWGILDNFDNTVIIEQLLISVRVLYAS